MIFQFSNKKEKLVWNVQDVMERKFALHVMEEGVFIRGLKVWKRKNAWNVMGKKFAQGVTEKEWYKSLFYIGQEIPKGGIKMAERKCDICGQNKDVYGGKICQSGHFTCKSCYYSNGVTYCQICQTELK